MRILFDSMIFDRLLLDPGVVAAMKASIHQFFVTPIQYDQWNRMRDEVKRERIKVLALELTLTAPADWLGRSGEPNSKHTEDWQIARAAQAFADLLVTDDKKLLLHSERNGLAARSYEGFRNRMVGEVL